MGHLGLRVRAPGDQEAAEPLAAEEERVPNDHAGHEVADVRELLAVGSQERDAAHGDARSAPDTAHPNAMPAHGRRWTAEVSERSRRSGPTRACSRAPPARTGEHTSPTA